MRIVIDTNVMASAIFFGGKPRKLIDLLLTNKLDSYITKEISDEYMDTVEYLCNKYTDKKISIPLTQIISACHLIESTSNIKVCRDPDDNKFISCAFDAKCLYIVSGDKDLLSLGGYEDIEIMTVADFLDRVWKEQ